jgi:hypothetical protein
MFVLQRQYEQRNWDNMSALTMHLPFNRSLRLSMNGGPPYMGPGSVYANHHLDMHSRPESMPVMSTMLMRWLRLKGGDMAHHRVLIENPNSGEMQTLTFTNLSTDYRGARQHWRVAGAELGWDMGDWYE